jgi:ankyrin repeat protein
VAPHLRLGACLRGDLALPDLAIDAGAPETVDRNGHTFLHLAARGGHVNMVERLLRDGADPNVLDAAGIPPLDVALSAGAASFAASLATVDSSLDCCRDRPPRRRPPRRRDRRAGAASVASASASSPCGSGLGMSAPVASASDGDASASAAALARRIRPSVSTSTSLRRFRRVISRGEPAGRWKPADFSSSAS